MDYYFREIKDYKNPIPVYFLCGVIYNYRKPYEDKRVVLKEYLCNKGYSSIILEEHFVIGNDNNYNNKLGYKMIGLKNLNDVELLACMAVDGIFVLHESHSTAAEIALFASNDDVAKKVFVLVPDRENAQKDHFSGFLKLGYDKLIPKPITFYPVTEKYITSENNIEIFTYFNNNQIGENLSKEIDNSTCIACKHKNLMVQKGVYNVTRKEGISYFIESNSNLFISVDLEHLRCYMIAIFSIPEFRSEIKNTSNYFDGLAVCEKWFKSVLLNTIQNKEKIQIKEYNIEILNSINVRLNIRKAISFALYIFHAMNWIKIDMNNERKITITKKSDNSCGFKSVYEKYENIIYEENQLDIEGIIL